MYNLPDSAVMYMKFYSARICFVLSSFREGLSVALMEAMTEGLPVVCSRIRGNVDLIEEGVGGYLVAPGEESEYRIAFTKLYEMKKNEPQENLKKWDKAESGAK